MIISLVQQKKSIVYIENRNCSQYGSGCICFPTEMLTMVLDYCFLFII